MLAFGGVMSVEGEKFNEAPLPRFICLFVLIYLIYFI